MCRGDASSWNLPLVRRGDEATTPFRRLIPCQFCWVRMLVILPHCGITYQTRRLLLLFCPYAFYDFVFVGTATAVDRATSVAEAQMVS